MNLHSYCSSHGNGAACRAVRMSRRRFLLSVLLAAFCILGQAAAGQEAERPVRAKITTGRTEVFEQEPFTFVLEVEADGVRLDRRISVTGLPPEDRLHRGPFEELPQKQEKRGNRIVEVRRYRCTARAPVAGNLVLAPELQVAVLTRNRGLFGFSTIRTLRPVRVAPVSLRVRPLPEAGRPADFSGAVGRFSLEAEARPAVVAVGELVTVHTRVKGVGYLGAAEPPRLDAGPYFKVYEPEEAPSDETGVRAFKQVVIPQSTNAAALTSVVFTFFDPRTASYRTIRKGPLPIAFREAESPVAAREWKPERRPGPDAPAGTGVDPSEELRSPGPPVSVLSLIAWAVAFAAGAAAARNGVVLFSRLRSRGGGRLLPAALVVVLAATAFGSARWGIQRQKRRAALAATAVRQTEARLAPGGTALVLFDIREGAALRVLDTHGRWAKVADGERRGWIPRDTLKQADSSHAHPPRTDPGDGKDTHQPVS